jgi:hypothetical protein
LVNPTPGQLEAALERASRLPSEISRKVVFAVNSYMVAHVSWNLLCITDEDRPLRENLNGSLNIALSHKNQIDGVLADISKFMAELP